MKINVEIDFDDIFTEDAGSLKDMVTGIIRDDVKYYMKRHEGYKAYIKKAADDAVGKLVI